MSYTISRPSSTQRSGLLSIVIGLHVGIFLLIMAAKTVMPQIMEIPLVVDLIQPPEAQKEPEAKPLPVAKTIPVKLQKTLRQQTPQPEATQSAEPTAAPVVAPADTKAAPTVVEAATQARFDADYLRNPPPPYPPLSRRMGEEGKVVLRVTVSPQGTAEEIEIKASSGSQRLDDAAVNTVKRWKFIPAKRGDVPVQSRVLVPIIFKLEQ